MWTGVHEGNSSLECGIYSDASRHWGPTTTVLPASLCRQSLTPQLLQARTPRPLREEVVRVPEDTTQVLGPKRPGWIPALLLRLYVKSLDLPESQFFLPWKRKMTRLLGGLPIMDMEHLAHIVVGVTKSCLTLRPRGLQHARLPCPSLFPGAYSNSCPLSWWCHPAISFSVAPFSCPQSFPASGSFPVIQLLASGGQSTGVPMAPMKEENNLPSLLRLWGHRLSVEGEFGPNARSDPWRTGTERSVIDLWRQKAGPGSREMTFPFRAWLCRGKLELGRDSGIPHCQVHVHASVFFFFLFFGGTAQHVWS